MPRLCVNGTELHYEDSGGTGPAVAFSHGLLFDTRLFEAQVAALRGRYRCVAWDHRGQGRSADDPRGAIDIETVTADAAALIETLDLAPVHFVGLSMGGFVGLRLAARRPELLRSLVLMDTSADPEPRANVPRYRLLNFVARFLGLGVVASRVLPILFARSFLSDRANSARVAEQRRRLVANRRSIWRAVNGVIERAGVAHELGRIRLPTLVMVGDEDVATVPAKAEALRDGIAGATLLRIPRAGHSAPVENPEAVTAALRGFLDGLDARRSA
jgi:pimeloyl-ACP methyl ester carboxylesterase